jgi:hydrogenase-4 component B
MELVIASLLVYLSGAFVALFSGSHSKRANRVAVLAAIVGSVLGLTALWLTRGQTISFRSNWSLPYGEISLTLDSLSRFFLLIFYTILIPIALYGYSYMTAYEHRNLGTAWFFFLLLITAMDVVVLADNMMLFLLAWEIMSVAAFFVVVFEDDKPQVRQAGYIYFIASHIGTAFLFILFWLLQQNALTGFNKPLLLLLGLIGFGVKAGLVPLHVWLPEAHPAAPSHVSALMSGLVIKTGLYGILRLLITLSPLPSWTGELLLLLGIISGLYGILYALAEKDIKRLLAYSSIENMGIIFIGLGIGFIGLEQGATTMALFALSGCFLHILNHAILKPILFISAGSVYQQTHTRNLEQLGGLLKIMPVTGKAFLFGATGLAGLPPLNGFIGELLIYLAAFSGIGSVSKGLTVWPVAAILALVLIGGLALFTFAKAFGTVFLGEPRVALKNIAETSGALKTAIGILAGLALLVVVFSFWIVAQFQPILTLFSTDLDCDLLFRPILLFYSAMVLVLIALFIMLWLLRKMILRKRTKEESGTWDCGYAAPNGHMQYTASSFVQPLTDMIARPLSMQQQIIKPDALLAKNATFNSQLRDMFVVRIYEPAFAGIDYLFTKLQWLQHGRLNFYILYVAVTLLILLLWYGGSQ